jgi:hypothetical protein
MSHDVREGSLGLLADITTPILQAGEERGNDGGKFRGKLASGRELLLQPLQQLWGQRNELSILFTPSTSFLPPGTPSPQSTLSTSIPSPLLSYFLQKPRGAVSHQGFRKFWKAIFVKSGLIRGLGSLVKGVGFREGN